MIACSDYLGAMTDFLCMEEYEGWSLTHSFFARMKGLYVDGERAENGDDLVAMGIILDRETCEQLGRDIADKSKADFLTKSIAVIQITRFLLEMISRAAVSLPLSPLEYFTCAQVVCALLTYIFWFDKPHNVQEPLRLTKASQTPVNSASKYREYRERYMFRQSESSLPLY